MWMIGAYRRTHVPNRLLGLRGGGHLALSLHSSNEPAELSQWSPRHSTISAVITVARDSGRL